MFFIFQEVVKTYGKRVIFPFLIIVILIFCFFVYDRKSQEENVQLLTVPQTASIQETNSTSQKNTEEQNNGQSFEKVMVDIKGAVQYPGVYELTTEDRIIDAIEKAGGYTKEADSTSINHAQKLQDEMVIYVPKKGEELSEQVQLLNQTTNSSHNTSSYAANGKVNINTASEAELTTLPGIGPAKAQAIISYREENGPFKTIDEIKNVSGIGEKTFEKLKDSISVK